MLVISLLVLRVLPEAGNDLIVIIKEQRVHAAPETIFCVPKLLFCPLTPVRVRDKFTLRTPVIKSAFRSRTGGWESVSAERRQKR